jgi:uroporphyrinogen decarboxylase
MTTMSQRARVLAALRGQPVDRVPISFWLHNFATENSARGLADETLRLEREFGWDYLKPQSRAQGFAEMWGLTYRPSGQRDVPYSVTRTPLAAGADFAGLQPADPSSGALGEQLEALRLIRAALGPDRPIIWTVFSPLMVAQYLIEGGRTRLFELARSEPASLERGLEAICQTLERYARLCLEQGADGLFYATNLATADLTTAEECRRFQRPHDLRILAAVRSAPFNLLHICGDGILLDQFVDYPATAFSFAQSPANPSLAEVQRRTGKAVVGGLPGKPGIMALSPERIAEQARTAIRELGGRWLLLGPDCSVNPETPDALLHAATRAAQETPIV